MTRDKDRHDCYVYVIRSGELVKVGSTGNVKRRFMWLRSMHHDAKLIMKIRSTNYVFLEKLLHIQLKEHHSHHEWFRNENDVIKIIYNFMKHHGEIVGAYEIHFLGKS